MIRLKDDGSPDTVTVMLGPGSSDELLDVLSALMSEGKIVIEDDGYKFLAKFARNEPGLRPQPVVFATTYKMTSIDRTVLMKVVGFKLVGS